MKAEQITIVGVNWGTSEPVGKWKTGGSNLDLMLLSFLPDGKRIKRELDTLDTLHFLNCLKKKSRWQSGWDWCHI